MTIRVITTIEVNDTNKEEIRSICGKEWWDRTDAENSAIHRFINRIDEKFKDEKYIIEEIEVWDDDEWEWETLVQY